MWLCAMSVRCTHLSGKTAKREKGSMCTFSMAIFAGRPVQSNDLHMCLPSSHCIWQLASCALIGHQGSTACVKMSISLVSPHCLTNCMNQAKERLPSQGAALYLSAGWQFTTASNVWMPRPMSSPAAVSSMLLSAWQSLQRLPSTARMAVSMLCNSATSCCPDPLCHCTLCESAT